MIDIVGELKLCLARSYEHAMCFKGRAIEDKSQSRNCTEDLVLAFIKSAS